MVPEYESRIRAVLIDANAHAARLPALFRLVEAPSLYGHDAFLKEDEAVAAIELRVKVELAKLGRT